MATAPDQANGQRKGINQDESKVPEYVLPDLMTSPDGTKANSIADWKTSRRKEVLELFTNHVYGNFPDKNVTIRFSTDSTKQWEVLGGKAIRKEIGIQFGQGEEQVTATLLLTVPKSDKPVPCFLGYNFDGNHTTTDDKRVSITKSWVRNKNQVKQNQASEDDRGCQASRWPCAEIIKQGYALGTMYYGDVDPDYHDEFQNGIHPLFYAEGQTKPTKNQWGSIGAWAYGLSQALNYLETDTSVNAKRVAVIGHSRLGKTSLWTGATDQRFWITISNNSGCGGAALHRRKFGETVQVINRVFPHWFCDQFVEYNEKEAEIPVDQHMLMALIAPRPVYVASATADLWADPKGEFLSLAHSDPVYALYGESAMGKMPNADQAVINGSRGYHLRKGKHNITGYDWSKYIEFANQHLK